MKNFLRSTTLLLLFVSAFLTSCDKSSNNPTSTPNPGIWKVVYFYKDADQSSKYTSYTFDFQTNGTIKASNGSQSWTGTWQTGVDDSKDKFVISFNGSIPSALEEISEDWEIFEMTDSFMHFEHTSGGNGGHREIHFSKQ